MIKKPHIYLFIGVVALAIAAAIFMLSSFSAYRRQYTLIDGKKIEFASEAEAEKWREPLERLLSNVEYTQYSDDAIGAIIGTKAPHPERPSIVDGYGCALFDLTCDGTPELLVNRGGGSAGNAPYEVYDIYTGESIASLDSSPDNAVCCYYNSEDGEINVINKYSWRSGWSAKLFFTTVITPDKNGGFTEKLYLESYYEMEIEHRSENDFSIVCSGMSCSVWGKSVEPESFLGECEYFDENYIRIKETEIKYISWYTVKENGDTPEERGRKMAEALLSSGQRFIAYDK